MFGYRQNGFRSLNTQAPGRNGSNEQPSVAHQWPTRPRDNPAPIALCVSHPILSASELECLAQRIATIDGVSLALARQQIARLRAAPFGLNVLAMRRHVRRLPLAPALSRPLH